MSISVSYYLRMRDFPPGHLISKQIALLFAILIKSNKMRTIRNRIVGGLAFMLFQLQYLAAQVPTHLPGKKPEPVPITPVNIIILILIPLGLLFFYIWWLRQNRKKAEEKRVSEEKEKESS